jgi:hypothetical protein
MLVILPKDTYMIQKQKLITRDFLDRRLVQYIPLNVSLFTQDFRLSSYPSYYNYIISLKNGDDLTATLNSYLYNFISYYKENGTIILGNVDVQNGSKDLATIKAEISQWRFMYDVDGIMIENMPKDNTYISTIEDIKDIVQSLGLKGLGVEHLFVSGDTLDYLNDYLDYLDLIMIIGDAQFIYNNPTDLASIESSTLGVLDKVGFLYYNINDVGSSSITLPTPATLSNSVKLTFTVVKNSIYITYTENGTQYTAKDDGNGKIVNVTGVYVDETQSTINYETGDLNLVFSSIDDGSTINISYKYKFPVFSPSTNAYTPYPFDVSINVAGNNTVIGANINHINSYFIELTYDDVCNKGHYFI